MNQRQYTASCWPVRNSGWRCV